MKELWMQVGMIFRLTDKEVEAILGQDDGYDNVRAIVKNAMDEGRFELYGDIEIPEVAVESFNDEYGTQYEIAEYGCCW